MSKLDDALPLMADVALRPTFSQTELDRLRKERLTSLLQTRDNPAGLAAAGFSRLIFGPEHRYGTLAMGNDASNGEMTVDDLRSFYTALLPAAERAPHRRGRRDGGEPCCRNSKRRSAAGRTARRGAKAATETAAQHGARQIYLIDKPGAAQSQIRIGWVGVPRSTPDYYALDVLNTMLGGSFTSRLNQNLREEHGYAYGASSGFDMRLSAGPFMASAGVQSDKTTESLQEFFKELTAIRQPVPADELTRVEELSGPGISRRVRNHRRHGGQPGAVGGLRPAGIVVHATTCRRFRP